MITRRSLLAAGAAASLAAFVKPAFAEDWKAKYPELVLAVVPAENATGVTERWNPFVEYLSKELGVKVTLRIAPDYAAVIEGQRSGNVHIGAYGPAAFARALTTGVNTEAFAIDVNSDGSKGYYSVFYVKADSPYQKIEDLQGKVLGLVDPNSGSGYNMPLFTLDKMGIDPAKQFSKMLMTGSHENAVMALVQGTADVVTNWWNADDDSNLTRMLKKGMVKNADGSPMKKEDFRIVLKSELIMNSPTAYLADMPENAKKAISQAFFDAPAKAPEAFAKLSDGKNKPWEPITNKDYDKTVELVKFVDALKKKAS